MRRKLAPHWPAAAEPVTFLCLGDDELLNLKVFFQGCVKGGCGIND